MAIPWGGQGIPYSEFLIKLTSFPGVTIKHSATQLVDGDGITNIAYVERVTEGEILRCPILYSMEGELVQPNIIRSVCAILKIGENEFSKQIASPLFPGR